MYELNEKEQGTIMWKSFTISIMCCVGFIIFMRLITGPEIWEVLFDNPFFIIVIIVIVVIIYFGSVSNMKDKIIGQHKSKNMEKRRIEIKEKDKENKKKVRLIIEKRPNFKVDDEIMQTFDGNVLLFAAYDNSKKQLFIIQGNGKEIFLFDNNQILKCELRVKTESKTETIAIGETTKKGTIPRALVGGVLTGGAGAIVGGMSAKEKNKINSTSKTTSHSKFFLDIYTNNPKISCLTIAREDQKTLQKWYGYILAMLQKDDEENVDRKKTDSVADEILKFKKLLEEGILSKDEFENAKQKLLNN